MSPTCAHNNDTARLELAHRCTANREVARAQSRRQLLPIAESSRLSPFLPQPRRVSSEGWSPTLAHSVRGNGRGRRRLPSPNSRPHASALINADRAEPAIHEHRRTKTGPGRGPRRRPGGLRPAPSVRPRPRGPGEPAGSERAEALAGRGDGVQVSRVMRSHVVGLVSCEGLPPVGGGSTSFVTVAARQVLRAMRSTVSATRARSGGSQARGRRALDEYLAAAGSGQDGGEVAAGAGRDVIEGRDRSGVLLHRGLNRCGQAGPGKPHFWEW